MLREYLIALKNAIQVKDKKETKRIVSELNRLGVDNHTIAVLLKSEKEWI